MPEGAGSTEAILTGQTRHQEPLNDQGQERNLAAYDLKLWLVIASPQQRVSEDWYLGTANAVYQNIYSIEKSGAGMPGR
jgi:ADP-glucose pyrophosphorylase